MSDKLTWESAVQELVGDPSMNQLVQACYFDLDVEVAYERWLASAEWTAILLMLPKNRGRAIEFGAGRGLLSCALAEHGWEVIAVEPDRSSLVGTGCIRALAHRRGVCVRVVEEYAESVSLEAGQADLVVCRQAMHHAKDLSSFCARASALLKLGGQFWGLREHVVENEHQLRSFLQQHPLHNRYGGEHAYTLREYRVALQAAGLRITAEIGPYDSDINLAPGSVEQLRSRWTSRFGIMIGTHVFSLWLTCVRRLRRPPGRLYSFVCQKD
jgi:hypothetical protein